MSEIKNIIEKYEHYKTATDFITELKSIDIKNYNAYININGKNRTLAGHILHSIASNKKLKSGSNTKKEGKKTILILEYLNKQNTDYSLAYNKNEKGSLLTLLKK